MKYKLRNANNIFYVIYGFHNTNVITYSLVQNLSESLFCANYYAQNKRYNDGFSKYDINL